MRHYRFVLVILSLFLFSINLSAHSQTEHINCIIFVDGKLPYGCHISEGYFSYTDSIGGLQRIDFNYIIGEIHLKQENFIILQSLNVEDEISINFTHYEERAENSIYTGILKVEWLSYRYLIIRITTLNKKKGEYYFGYSTPGISKHFIKNEYYMFED